MASASFVRPPASLVRAVASFVRVVATFVGASAGFVKASASLVIAPARFVIASASFVGAPATLPSSVNLPLPVGGRPSNLGQRTSVNEATTNKKAAPFKRSSFSIIKRNAFLFFHKPYGFTTTIAGMSGNLVNTSRQALQLHRNGVATSYQLLYLR